MTIIYNFLYINTNKDYNIQNIFMKEFVSDIN